MKLLIDGSWMILTFISCLLVGAAGLGLMRFLPKRIRQWIEDLDK